MKNLRSLAVLIIVVVGFLIGSQTGAMATPIESTPILMIDGIDSGVGVNIGVKDVTTGFDFGFLTPCCDGISFNEIVANGTTKGTYAFTGGDVVDFAIRRVSDGKIFSLGDEPNGDNFASLAFSFPIDPSYSKNPVVTYTYYSKVAMIWDLSPIGGGVIGYDVVTAKDMYDGMAPAPVPEPATLILLGSGLAGLGLWGRRSSHKRFCP